MVYHYLLLLYFRVNLQNLSASSLAPTTEPNFDSPSVFQVTQPVDHSEGPMWDGEYFCVTSAK